MHRPFRASTSGEEKAQILDRARGEYCEMPGLTLTLEQAARLWNLDNPTCEETLTTLVDEGFLRRKPNGTYTRAAEFDQNVRPRMAKADLNRKADRT